MVSDADGRRYWTGGGEYMNDKLWERFQMLNRPRTDWKIRLPWQPCLPKVAHRYSPVMLQCRRLPTCLCESV